jgi:lipocalin
MKCSKFIQGLMLICILFFAFASAVHAGPKGPTIVDVAIEINTEGPFTGQFDTLIAAVQASDPIVLNTLSGNGQRTVFAPTDDAFLQLSLTPENITTLSRSELTDILLYHVAHGRRDSTSVLEARRIRTLNRGFLFQNNGTLTDNLDRTANIIAPDVFAANGVIHAIDAVVLPFLPKNLPPPQTVDFVDLARYAGLWYEIARYDTLFDEDAVAVTATYTLNPDGTVGVLNQGRIGTIDGPPTSIEGFAVTVDATNAKLLVEFDRPELAGIKFDYWVIDLGADYEYAVVSSASRGVLYILSRTPTVDPQFYNDLIAHLAQIGFDADRIVLTPQLPNSSQSKRIPYPGFIADRFLKLIHRLMSSRMQQ